MSLPASLKKNLFDWHSTAKEKARWFLPSTLPSRKSADQIADGKFVARVVDIDGGGATFVEVERAVLIVASGAIALVSSTKSAAFRAPRWRIIIPLKRRLLGGDTLTPQKPSTPCYARRATGG